MVRSLYTAATGMEAQQLYMDTISHNLSNVNTNGFKRQKVEFHDLLYQTLREPGVRAVEGGMSPAGLEVGLGVKPAATQRIFSQGSLTQTNNLFDVAIQGDGFFQVSLPDGTIAYTRDGQLKLSADGTVVTSSGYPLYPQLALADGAQEFSITAQGAVSVRMPSEESATEIGQIELAHFVNSSGLKAIGQNLYTASDASAPAIISTPGRDGAGTVSQGYVEASNVEIVTEMVNMISAQRAYEIVSKAIQVSEDMMQIANNLRR
ncbi:MAG: flagellar basal-body rod protein FlgG [Chitinivibrionales bacterium]|nr:flagellar basal-body rod protein FlgG [Chitinivibrionales bacterium]